MTLTRKDFIQRAKLIRSFRSPHVRTKLTNSAIKEFKKSNIRFDAKRFKAFIKKK